MFSWIKKIFANNTVETEEERAMRYMIVGLGNIGDEYVGTRHNIGFRVVDAFAKKQGAEWQDRRYGSIAKTRVKNAEITLLKPSTYMNQEKIPVENLLIIVDDLSLPVGKVRMRGNGGAGGHNGLKSVESCMMTPNYARIRFGIGNDYPRGAQADFVLSAFGDEDDKLVEEKLEYVGDMIKSFCLQGLDRTMNQYNKK